MNTSIRWLNLTACLLLALAGGGCKKKQVPQAEPVDTAASNLQIRVSPVPLVVTQQVAVASARASANASAHATIDLGASANTNVRSATEVVSADSAAPSSSDTSASISASSAVTGPAAAPADVVFAAGQGKPFESQIPAKVRVEGTSTLHAWTVDGQIIVGQLEVDPAFAISSLQPGKIKAQAIVRIPVRTLKSGNKMMDDIMYRQMKMTQHRDITYRLTEWTLKEAPSSAGPAQCDATGFLIVSGVTNAITMPVTLESAASGKLLIKGSANLKMTDFGITPPELTLGVTPIKTGNEVKVSFEWLLAPKT